ncbi:uncharacterized protein DUF2815 [Anaerospora hongkongensis]|uniref:Uncharacterized protein DUF2815 n=1 Tax=Anaerospora hongkongensis TaxID=244830 RepID=A0A4R1PUI6_9FIRM|nr:DUF2815 family protein [Anaerospora hongkongensis]TCL35623.1 uncharacterized protein DUF2815 [Anaerospora hongkongensis]
MTQDNQSTKVITGKVRLSFVALFTPSSIDGGDEKFSAVLMIPKDDKNTLKMIKAAVDAAKESGKSKKWGGKIPPSLDLPLHDGDTEKDLEKYPEFAGHYYVNAKSNTKPEIVKPIGKGADGKMKFQEITDTTEVYSGCYARVSLNFYPFDKKGNKGVAAGLNSVVKVQDGEFLGGRSSAQDDFANVEFDDGDDEDFMS